MRSRPFLLAAVAGAALWGPSALAAAPASSVLVLPSLTPRNASSVISASDRLVWDRQTGLAVAEVPQAHMAALASLTQESCEAEAGPGEFGAAVERWMPDFAAGSRSSKRFAVKEPVTLVRPPQAPRARPAQEAAGSTCLYEGFETLPVWYENGGNWWHYQGGQPYNDVGNYFWLDDNCDAYSGSWEADAIMGGTLGQTLPCGTTYDYDTDSWLEYAPWITCVSGVPAASLSFFTKVQTEPNYDLFYYVVSVDGTNYVGYSLSGDYSDTWYAITQDMRNWTQLGDLTSYPRLALAFVFQSDNQINQGFGVRLDDITLSATGLSAAVSSDKTTGTVPLAVHFTGTALGGTAPFTYAWDFGDGSPRSSDQNPAHTYTDPGSYTVALTIQDATGATATGRLTITATPNIPPSVTSMAKASNPFRFIVLGSNLQQGIAVYINGAPWPNVVWKNPGKIVVKGGAALKAAAPKGAATTFLFENPDGLTATYTLTW